MKIPLKFFEKLNGLTPSHIQYLMRYKSRLMEGEGKGNPALLERIGTILGKPRIKDPIYSKDTKIDYDLYYSDRHKRSQSKKVKKIERKKIIPKKHINFFKKMKDKLIAPLRIKPFQRLQP